MYKIFIIFCIFGTIFANDEESNEKYIDLLPEEEKQEFLNRIARRILEGINSDDTPNQSHVEINDDQLNEHHAYVQDIINEESQNLKNERRKDGGSTENKYIDLTLRDGKREKRKNDEKIQPETTSEPDYNVISVKPVYGEDYNDAQDAKKVLRNENIEVEQGLTLITNTSRDMPTSESVTEQGVQQVIEHLRIDDKNPRKDMNNNYTQSTEIEDFEPNFTESTSESNVDYEIITSTTPENTNTTIDDKVSWGSTQKKYLSLEDESINDEKSLINTSSTTEESVKSLVTTNLESETKASTIDTESVTKDNLTETTLNSVIGNFSYIDGESRRHSEILNETSTSTINIDIFTTTILPPNISNISREIGTTTKEDIKESIAHDSSPTKIEQNVSTPSFKIEKDIKPNLRQRLDLFESASEIPKLNVVATPKGEYKVYEIAAKKPSFALINDINLPYKQPNYVPIYNYAPENAYFKPNNRFGPNLYNEEEDSYERNLRTRVRTINHENDLKLDIPESSRFFGHKKLNSYSTNVNYPSKNKISKLYELLKPSKKVINQNIHYNPYDYLDIDYNINRFNGLNMLRSGYDGSQYNRFPNSDDSDHPINMYKNDNVKDHITAVRKLMYLLKIFGTKTDNPTIRKSELDPIKINKKTKGVDYYFERIHSDEDVLVSPMTIPSRFKIKQKHNAVPKNGIESNRFLEPDNLVPFYELNEYGEDKINFNSFFQGMINVLKDIIKFDNKVLELYAWLPTTVELQGTIRTLLETSYFLKKGYIVPRKYLELFKYVAYLYEISKIDIEENLVKPKKYPEYLQFRNKKIHKKRVLPKNKRKQKFRQPLIMWRDFAKYIRNVHEIGSDKLNIFDEVEDFLQNLLYNLGDFHEAIKNIAGITTYRTQNWFNDLQNIYFNKASRKQIGQVVLHSGLVNLLDKIKKDTNNGVEADYRRFIKNNKRDVQRTKEDFKFVLQVLYELNRM
ncbi:unnamed protein product, partial [Brenthis ino]